MLMLLSQVKRTGSERSISNLLCVSMSPFVTQSLKQLSTYCLPVPEQGFLLFVPGFSSTLSLFLSLFTLAHSNSVGDEAFPKGVFVCVREREGERGRVKCYGGTNSKQEGEKDTS